MKKGRCFGSAGVVGDTFPNTLIICSALCPPIYNRLEFSLDTLAVAVPKGKAVPRNCVITYGKGRPRVYAAINREL